MCGIYGFFWKDETLIQKMIDVSFSRGPDANGTFVDNNISLGHNLLSVRDTLDNSKQPWVMDDGNYVLCFNGEIYNYSELKNELKQKGFSFKTHVDTEVLAFGLLDQGVQFLKKIDGMYTIAWYNKKKRTVLLARDVIGSRPLYYMMYNGKLVFSSTIKSLLTLKVDRLYDDLSFKLQMAFCYVPGPRTHFKNISKLIPGEALEFSIDKSSLKNRELFYQEMPPKIDPTPHGFRQALEDGVKETLSTHRQVGIFLSGGLDSAAILYEAQKFNKNIKTFTVRFDTDDGFYNEDADLAKKLSELYQTEHHELLITEENFIRNLKTAMITATSEPIGSQNVAPRYMLNNLASKHGCVVSLTGDGGDELLFGYKRHLRLLTLGNDDTFKKWFKIKNRYFNGAVPAKIDREEIFNYIHSYIPLSHLPIDPLDCHLFYDWNTHLPEEYLIREDSLGSFFSIEARYPMLTNVFRRYTQSIDSSQKLSLDLPTKHIMREAYRGFLPDYIVDKRKTAFMSPLIPWARQATSCFRQFIDAMLDENYSQETNHLFNLDFLRDVTYTDNSRNIRAMLNVANYRLWAKTYNIVF